jgi:hypothetical protein
MASMPHSWEIKPGVANALGTLGTLAAFYLFASPLYVSPRAVPYTPRAETTPRRRTFRRIVVRKSTEEFSGTQAPALRTGRRSPLTA